MTTTREQTRDRKNGRYAHTGFEALCVCGHTLGYHTAETADGYRPCIIGDFQHEGCDCERFRKSRAKAK